MNAIFTILLAWGLLTVLYRFGVRPLLKSVIVERIERRELEVESLPKTDQLELEAVAKNGLLADDDFCRKFLLRVSTIKERLDDCSISDFLHFMFFMKLPESLFEDLKRFQREASPEMKAVHEGMCKDMGLWLMINSPFYFIFGSGVIAICVLLRFRDESNVKRDAQAFVSAEACGCAA